MDPGNNTDDTFNHSKHKQYDADRWKYTSDCTGNDGSGKTVSAWKRPVYRILENQRCDRFSFVRSLCIDPGTYQCTQHKACSRHKRVRDGRCDICQIYMDKEERIDHIENICQSSVHEFQNRNPGRMRKKRFCDVLIEIGIGHGFIVKESAMKKKTCFHIFSGVIQQVFPQPAQASASP